jgi:guanylate kinase
MSNDVSTKGSGRLFVISAPSGAGKTTLVRKLMELLPFLRFSVSYTTREKRTGETDGTDYFFINKSQFENMRDDGDFLEYALVFGNYYGTSRNQVSESLKKGHDVILEIDWQGAEQVRKNMPECISVFVLPPSLQVLEKRLRGRGTDSEEVIQRRLSEASGDISHWNDFKHVVINEDLERSAEQLVNIITDPDVDEKANLTALKRRIDAIMRAGGDRR